MANLLNLEGINCLVVPAKNVSGLMHDINCLAVFMPNNQSKVWETVSAEEKHPKILRVIRRLASRNHAVRIVVSFNHFTSRDQTIYGRLYEFRDETHFDPSQIRPAKIVTSRDLVPVYQNGMTTARIYLLEMPAKGLFEQLK